MTRFTRRLTEEERTLVQWMLLNGETEARDFLVQLDLAEAEDWRCPCGCASFNLRIQGRSSPEGGMHPIADFLFGDDDALSGVFVYEQEGILSGMEVYGLAGEAPKSLPQPEELRPFARNSS